MARNPVQYTVVDAFTEFSFSGNPAAVCLLKEERDDRWLQSVATEFNLSQTCYLTRIDNSDDPVNLNNASSIPRFRLRWFTPVFEVRLCGHATLAAAHTLFSTGLVPFNVVEFETKSGVLTAKKVPDVSLACASGREKDEDEDEDRIYIELDFPVDLPTEFDSLVFSHIVATLQGLSIVEIKRTSMGDDLLVEVSSWESLKVYKPKTEAIEKCPGRGIIITAAGHMASGFDFCSRFFCPKFGINEDPVCGGAHCALAAYWGKKLGKCDLKAYQASQRGGVVNIHLDEQRQRVLLQGKAVTVMRGCIIV